MEQIKDLKIIPIASMGNFESKFKALATIITIENNIIHNIRIYKTKKGYEVYNQNLDNQTKRKVLKQYKQILKEA